MANPTVILAYRRVEGDLSSGGFYLHHPEGNQEVLSEFAGVQYIDMMKVFAGYLADFPHADGAIQRTDRPGLVQLPLSAEELELFRKDPAEAIRQRIVPPQRVFIGIDRAVGPSSTSVVLVQDGVVLDAGYASLADCFGDVVFARARTAGEKTEVECHCCGEWSTLHRSTARNVVDGYTCTECNISLPLADVSASGWAGVFVSSLLATGREKFFLPRAWNNHQNWITRSELERRYNEYNKEKTS